jgi:hypothetical protein
VNISAAYSFLKLEPSANNEDIADAFEIAVFSIKKELFSKTIVLSRWKNKANMLDKLIEAKNVLLNTLHNDTTTPIEVVFDSSSLLTFMQDYERLVSASKLQFSNATADDDLRTSIQYVIAVQMHYEMHYMRFFSTTTSHVFTGKLSEQIDSAEIIRYLKNGGELSEFPNPCVLEFLRLERLNG